MGYYPVSARVAEIDAAISQLMNNERVRVFVDRNGERTEFTSASLSDLRSYRAEVLSQSGHMRGPATVTF